MTVSSQQRKLSELIFLIYAAGRDPSQWQKAIDAITNTFPGVTGHLQGYDQLSKTMPSQLTTNMSEEAYKPFVERVPEINVWWTTMGHLPVGEALSTDAHCPLPTIKNTEFYNDWLRPNDIASCVGCFLFKEDSRMAALGFHYSEKRAEIMTPQVMELVTLLAPHFQTAMEMNRELLTGYNATEKLIDKTKRPAFLLDSHRRIVYMNQAGEQVLEQRRGWRVGGAGVLDLLDESQSEKFVKLVNTITNPTIIGHSEPKGVIPFEINSIAEENPNTAFVTPALNGGFANSNPLATLLGEQYAQALVVLTFRRDRNDALSHCLSQLFPELTPTEVKISVALSEGITVEAYAIAAGVAVSTIRKHLGQIFRKTNTKQQSQLVALVLTLSQDNFL